MSWISFHYAVKEDNIKLRMAHSILKKVRTIEEQMKNNTKERQRIYKEVVFQIYSNYYMNCCLCGEEDIDVLTIDHINGNGSSHRKEFDNIQFTGIKIYRWLFINRFPEGYRVLCRNCNWREYLRSNTND